MIFFGQSPDENRQRLYESALDIAEDNLRTAVAYLRTRSDIDPARIGVGGQSFGATVSLEAAMSDPEIRSTVLIGMAGDLTPERPKNVLLVAGLYDELHPENELLTSLAAGTGLPKVYPGRIYGNFGDGTARELTEIPTVNHVAEVLRLIPERKWFL